MDLDWIRNGHSELIVITHAFEGNSRDYFVERSAKYFSKKGYDILIWHFRSCGGALNRIPALHIINAPDDLGAVIQHSKNDYQRLHLLAFSMGATTTLNYLANNPDKKIQSCTVVSAPLLLDETLKIFNHGWARVLYGRSFYRKLRKKLLKKATQFPDRWDADLINKTKKLEHLVRIVLQQKGKDPSYLKEISPLNAFERIRNPTLLINAQNDPFLGPSSYPIPKNPQLKTCYPTHGGHTGFSVKNVDYSLVEIVMMAFLSELAK